ncbi:hypothetical protein Dimus_020802 [Dionaea muscipula]
MEAWDIITEGPKEIYKGEGTSRTIKPKSEYAAGIPLLVSYVHRLPPTPLMADGSIKVKGVKAQTKIAQISPRYKRNQRKGSKSKLNRVTSKVYLVRFTKFRRDPVLPLLENTVTEERCPVSRILLCLSKASTAHLLILVGRSPLVVNRPPSRLGSSPPLLDVTG